MAVVGDSSSLNVSGLIVDGRSSTLFGLWGRRVADIQTTAAIGCFSGATGGASDPRSFALCCVPASVMSASVRVAETDRRLRARLAR